jgi:hypothetical protein
MDFITVLPKSEGNIVIMVVVDRVTNHAHFCSLYHPCKESTTATIFMEKIPNIHGVPKVIVSERNPIFNGKFWTEIFFCLGTQLAHNSS